MPTSAQPTETTASQMARTPSALDAIKIVMVNTSHPGNIGSAARAMRVMGLYNLTLVSPKKFPSKEATALASGALDVLENAQVTETLSEAIQDCHYVFGTSARSRHLNKEEKSIEAGALQIHEILREKPEAKIAILFGTERTGLTNEEVDLCQALFYIPTENNYNSLNIAAAIQIIAYELRRQNVIDDRLEKVKKPHYAGELPATDEAFEGFIQHFEQSLIETQFLDPANPKHLMRKIRHLYKKAELTQEEINILRGALTASQKVMAKDQ